MPKTSRLQMAIAYRDVGPLVFDRILRFRHRGTIYTTIQHGVRKEDKITITSGNHCMANAHLDPKEQKYLRERGVTDASWCLLCDVRVPQRVLREIDEIEGNV